MHIRYFQIADAYLLHVQDAYNLRDCSVLPHLRRALPHCRCIGRRYEYGRDYITKQPEPVKADRIYRSVHDRSDLLAAMNAALERVDHKLPPTVHAFEGIVGREPYPVSDKAKSILERLVQFGVTRFRSLFKSSRSRSEVVATFLAILELCKANRIHLAGTAEDCTVTNTDENLDSELNVTVDSY